MRYTLGILVGLTLALSGCQLHPPQPPASASQAKTLSFDDLLGTPKMVMTTKMSSDMPNAWEYDGDVAKQKVAKLVPVLKKGTPLPKSDALKTVPEVAFEIRVGGSMEVIDIWADRFSYQGNWYHLDNAPVATYSSVEKLEDGKQ